MYIQNLKRIETIEDDESEIIEAVRRMSNRYDFVVTRYDLMKNLEWSCKRSSKLMDKSLVEE